MGLVGMVSPRVRHARRLFAELGPTYERTGAMLSFGQDPRWRRFMVSRVRVPLGGVALDVAAGTGLVARELVRRNPSATVIALDQSAPMLREGRWRADWCGRSGARPAGSWGRAARRCARGIRWRLSWTCGGRRGSPTFGPGS